MKLSFTLSDGSVEDRNNVVSFSLDDDGELTIELDSYGDHAEYFHGVKSVSAQA